MNGSGRDWLLVLAANRKTASSKRVHGLIFISKEKGLGAKLLLCTNLVVCEHHVDGEKQFQDSIAIFFPFPLGCCWGNTLPQSSSKSEDEWNSGMERVESRLADLICSLFSFVHCHFNARALLFFLQYKPSVQVLDHKS